MASAWANNGDGVNWVKAGADRLGGIYQLDRFHLLRALRGALREDQVSEVYQACITVRESVIDLSLRPLHGEHQPCIRFLLGFLHHTDKFHFPVPL